MALYYVNDKPQANGDHEVHAAHCPFLPAHENRTFLGSYYNCESAVNKAKEHFTKVNGCYYCSKECHTS